MSKRATSPFQRSATNSIMPPSFCSSKLSKSEEVGEDGFRRHADGLQQNRHGHLAATVDTEEQDVLRVELEVQPRATVRNHAGREQQLARAVRFAAIMLEEHAGRTMQLRNNDALGAVDDKGTGIRHERNFAHVDFLFFDFLDRRLAGFAVQQYQAHLGAQRRSVGQARAAGIPTSNTGSPSTS